MAKWFYVIDGQEHGPVEPAALKHLAATGQLKPTDRVRREDMAEWFKVKNVKGLYEAAQSQPVTSAPITPAGTAKVSTPASCTNPAITTANPPEKLAKKATKKQRALGCGCLLFVCWALLMPIVNAVRQGVDPEYRARMAEERAAADAERAANMSTS